MLTSLKEGIHELNMHELETLSLKETLSLEEAICDAVAPHFMKEEFDESDANGISVDELQPNNQDHMAGFGSDDESDFDPDAHINDTASALSGLVESLLEDADAANGVDNMDDAVDEDDAEFADSDSSGLSEEDILNMDTDEFASEVLSDEDGDADGDE